MLENHSRKTNGNVSRKRYYNVRVKVQGALFIYNKTKLQKKKLVNPENIKLKVDKLYYTIYFYVIWMLYVIPVFSFQFSLNNLF